MSKIAFVVNHLGYRGTEVAVYDYMKGCRNILGWTPYIFYPDDGDMSAYDKFNEEFSGCMVPYGHMDSLISAVQSRGIDVVYWIKAGFNDNKLIPGIKNVVHAVFNVNEPHGDVYAYVSQWLSKENGNASFVPHIVDMPGSINNYRYHLSIPEDALVFGRYGGYDQFDVKYLGDAVYKTLLNKSNAYFLLMNTKPLGFNHPNVIYLEPTSDMYTKASFMNTIDCFLHGRTDGESFGLAVCEALYCNKPVITNIHCRDKHHIELMGDKGFYYSSSAELEAILTHFKRPEGVDYSKLVEQFSPERVMEQFQNVFLDL